jgi:hypothetical protein
MQELDYFRDFEQTMSEFKAHCTGAEHPKVIIDSKRQTGRKNGLAKVNCTPIVRQYGILNNNWGVFE